MDLPRSADIAVVGAGAAGLMTAIAAARECRQAPLSILLFDSRQKIGAKILISGGTRCNVTNRQVSPDDYDGGPRHFVKHVLEAFTPADSIRFFDEIGVPLELEPTGKYFPATHSGRTVLEALIKETARLGVVLAAGVRITEAARENDGFCLKGESSTWTARRLVLATGGLSYPETGSDGAGLRIARSFGHTIVTTRPALTPLTTDDSDWTDLAGITMPARLSFFKAGKKRAETSDSFLFTHFGFSGPAALDLSRHIASCRPGEEFRVEAGFLPDRTEEALKGFFERPAAARRAVKKILSEDFGLPARFVEVFLKKIGVDGRSAVGHLRGPERRRLIHELLHCVLPVSGVVGYKKAEVTAGGVDLGEVKVSTMGSKLVPGLYFAGEILDVDGRIGGFNFQWAWSTGAVAGRAAARDLLK